MLSTSAAEVVPLPSTSAAEVTSWILVKPLLPQFFEASEIYINEHFATSRTKQWLKALSGAYPEAREIFQEIKAMKTREFQRGLEKFCR